MNYANKNVVIVGGGSAGWITAAYMDAVLNGVGTPEKAVNITLVESDRIGRIGVGESTIPTMMRTLRTIGISERDFMRCCDATFKQSIKFVNFRVNDDRYFHPFTRLLSTQNDPKGHEWLSSDRSVPFASIVSVQPHTTDLALAPKRLEHSDYRGPLLYAYHIDAEKFALYLRDLAMSRGVKHVIGDVTDVETSGPETIAAVTTKQGDRLEADLFIDCTGFARVLIGKTLKAEFESFSDFLLCDRAIATRVPHTVRQPEKLEATTTCTAKSSGWIWNIPLQGRRGTGYVYSSAFLSDDEAEAEFIAHEGDHARDLDKFRIKFEAGHLTTPWKGNCVAIGLAGGFLEPLESTGLWFIEDGVDLLCELFPKLGDMTHCRHMYNEICDRRYKENADFINLHYCLTQRDDSPFWREIRKPERLSPTLKQRLDTWNTKLPSRSDTKHTNALYGYINYEYILFGMGWTPDAMRDPAPGAAPPDMAALDKMAAEAERYLPPQDKFLKDFLSGETKSRDGDGGESSLNQSLDPATALQHFNS